MSFKLKQIKKPSKGETRISPLLSLLRKTKKEIKKMEIKKTKKELTEIEKAFIKESNEGELKYWRRKRADRFKIKLYNPQPGPDGSYDHVVEFYFFDFSDLEKIIEHQKKFTTLANYHFVEREEADRGEWYLDPFNEIWDLEFIDQGNEAGEQLFEVFHGEDFTLEQLEKFIEIVDDCIDFSPYQKNSELAVYYFLALEHHREITNTNDVDDYVIFSAEPKTVAEEILITEGELKGLGNLLFYFDFDLYASEMLKHHGWVEFKFLGDTYTIINSDQ